MMKTILFVVVLLYTGYETNADFIKREEGVGSPAAEEDELPYRMDVAAAQDEEEEMMLRRSEDDGSGEEVELALRGLSLRPGRGLSLRPGRGLSLRPGRGLSLRPGRGLSLRPGRIVHRIGPKGRALDKRSRSSCSAKYEKAPFPSTMCEYDDAAGVSNLGVSAKDRQGILDLHNQLRSKVKPSATNMQKMYWDDEIAVIAQKWAQTCIPAHDEGWNRRVPGWHIGVGQNWAGGFKTWREVIIAWHDEVKDFTYGAQNTLALVGHYTQVVGNHASKVGCGYAFCPNNVNKENYVCNYAYGQTDFNIPYNAGGQCADCPRTCRNGLCDCRGKICQNGGTLDVNTCQCQCTEQASGPQCENLKCPNVEGYPCGTSPYDKTACKKFAAFPATCPILCGVCENRCPHMSVESCQNDGEVGPDCRCKCAAGFAGESCEKFASCKSDEDHCGQPYPYGYPKEYCTMYANIPEECPHMCGMC